MSKTKRDPHAFRISKEHHTALKELSGRTEIPIGALLEQAVRLLVLSKSTQGVPVSIDTLNTMLNTSGIRLAVKPS